jgi:hypothetical protein
MIRPKKKSKFLEEVTKSNFCSILNPKTCLPFWMGVSANAMESNAYLTIILGLGILKEKICFWKILSLDNKS